MGKVFFLITGLLIVGQTMAQAQVPVITYYNPDDYGASARNWGTAKDSLGFIYVANDHGVLRYDGKHWSRTDVPGRQVTSIGADTDGVVYVGTANNLGYLSITKQGEYTYVSLSDELPETQQPIWVFQTNVIGKTAYFLTQHAVYIYQPDYGLTYVPLENVAMGSSAIRGNYYFYDSNNIYRIINNKIHHVRSRDFKEAIDDDNIFRLLPYHGSEYLVITNDARFYVTSGGLRGSLKPWENDLGSATDVYMSAGVSDQFMDTYGDRLYTITDYEHGVLIFSQNGTLLYQLLPDVHVAKDSVQEFFFDDNNNLWLSTLDGIYKVHMSLDIRIYDSSFGLNTTINKLLYHNGFMYAATNSGLYFKEYDQKNFKLVEGTISQNWDVVVDQEYILSAGGNRGVYLVKDGVLLDRISWPRAAMTIAPSATLPSAFHVGKFNGYQIIRRSGNRLEEVDFPHQIQAVIRSAYETEEGTVWLGTPLQGLYSYDITSVNNTSAQFSDVREYGANHGFEYAEHNHVVDGPHEPLFTSRSGIYRFDDENDAFESVVTNGWYLNKNPYPNLKFVANEAWMLSDKRKLHFAGERVTEDAGSLLGIKPDIRDVISINDFYYLGTADGLYKMPHGFSPPKISTPLHITSIDAPELSEPINRLVSDNGNPVRIPYRHSEITISLALPDFTLEEGTQFRYRLSGVSDDWSPWRSVSDAIFTGLSNGHYAFEAQARNIFGVHSEVANLEIIIPPPFYRTHVAYLIYLLFVVGLVYGVIKINSYRLRMRNQYLEELIKERTDEILKQNQQLVEANKTKSRFLSIAAHDMRNPLGIIQGYADLIKETVPDKSNVVELSEHIVSIVDKMLSMINELLNPETDKNQNLPFSRTELELRPLVSQIVTHNRVLANQKNQQIFTELHETCPVLADRGRIYEIFDNIINNAIKYTPPEGIIVVQLRTVLISGKATRVQFSVSDHGPGVREEDREIIFGDYATSNNRTTGGENSSGLGLGIVKQLVEIHNGKVWVEDNPNHKTGARFIVELPCLIKSKEAKKT